MSCKHCKKYRAQFQGTKALLAIAESAWQLEIKYTALIEEQLSDSNRDVSALRQSLNTYIDLLLAMKSSLKKANAKLNKLTRVK